ncbi:MAG: PAS domain S-box protein [Deltaproteobacteria bacterium]|nr:PAS domain S-box protein [Deltaproteobacteria bacterium]
MAISHVTNTDIHKILIENTHDVIWTMTLDSEITFVNNAIKLFGYSPDEYIGTYLYQHVSTENLKILMEILQRRISSPPSEQSELIETFLNHRDGHAVPVEIHAWINFDESGNPIQIQGLTRDLTEKTRVLNYIKESEEKYRILFENTPTGIFKTSSDGRPLIINPAMARMLGFESVQETLDNYHSLSADYYVKPELRIDFLKKLKKNGSVNSFEYEAYTADKKTIWLSMNAWISEHLPDGSFTIEGFCTDITQFRKSAKGLKLSLNRFKDMAEMLPVAICETDSEGFITFANSKAGELFGYDTESNLGRFTVWQLIAPEDLEKAVDGFNVVLKSGQNFVGSAEYIGIRSDGSRFPMILHSAPLYNDDNVVGLRSAITDISQQKTIEQNLRRIEWMISGKQEKSTDELPTRELFVFDDSMMSSPSKGILTEMVGVKAIESIAGEFNVLLGSCVSVYEKNGDRAFSNASSSWCHLLNRTSYKNCFAKNQILADGKMCLCMESEWLYANKLSIEQGIPMDIDCSGGIRIHSVPIHVDGEFAGSISFGYGDPPSDTETLKKLSITYGITPDILLDHAKSYGSRPPFIIEMAKRRLESAAKLIGTMAEAKLAEKRRLAAEEKLLQAQKLESIGRLAGGVSHDFNNMLNVILGNAELLYDSLPSDSPWREDAMEIIDAAKRSSELTRQLLAFARKQNITPKKLDLNDTISGTLKMLGRLVHETIELIWKPGKSLPPVLMDPSQMDQILANLVVNARDAISNSGSITIETSRGMLPENIVGDTSGVQRNIFASLKISDTGVGMDSEVIQNIFEPFFTTKDKGRGTGLGLATVYGIVRQNKGFIHVDSEPGKGTSFTIFFPGMDYEINESNENSFTGELPKGTEKILLVEDETALLKHTKRVLENQGYSVLFASTPGEAIEIANKNHMDLDMLLTDVILPDMSGKELYSILIEKKKNLRCLFISGYSGEIISVKGILEKDINFLQKPFTTKALLKKIRSIFDEK